MSIDPSAFFFNCSDPSVWMKMVTVMMMMPMRCLELPLHPACMKDILRIVAIDFKTTENWICALPCDL